MNMTKRLGTLVRYGQLCEWLCAAGLTRSAIDVLISDGTIPREHFEHARRKAGSKKASKQRPKPAEKPVLIKGRAWYRPKTIAAKLNIDLPQ